MQKCGKCGRRLYFIEAMALCSGCENFDWRCSCKARAKRVEEPAPVFLDEDEEEF